MAESYTQVPPNSTGNKIRTRTKTIGAKEKTKKRRKRPEWEEDLAGQIEQNLVSKLLKRKEPELIAKTIPLPKPIQQKEVLKTEDEDEIALIAMFLDDL